MVKPGGVSGAWCLEGLEESGPEGGYMADPFSGMVYIARSATSWPEPVGWLADTGNVQRADMDVNAWCKQICAAFNVWSSLLVTRYLPVIVLWPLQQNIACESACKTSVPLCAFADSADFILNVYYNLLHNLLRFCHRRTWPELRKYITVCAPATKTPLA